MKLLPVAETYVDGEFDSVGNEGFRRLARSIGGDKRTKASIAMTAPVEQAPASQKIAMTAPVEQAKSGDRWRVAFVLPVSFTAVAPHQCDTIAAPIPSESRPMPPTRLAAALLIASVAAFAGCASVSVNPPIAKADPDTGYRLQTRLDDLPNQESLVVLAFSGGGTRAAAFSYGALEFLRRTEVTLPDGSKGRLLDAVGVITGISGGSFTALSYGLYGERLFDQYERRFLKRDVQGEIIARTLTPWNWSDLLTEGWGRSELAADLYDEILFEKATYADLAARRGPLILVSATDISTGARFGFNQTTFDIICSELKPMRLSRAAAASSAVPVVLSSITIRNYGGTCGWRSPAWTKLFLDSDDPPRPAARAIRSLRNLQAYGDGKERPYLHLVDGGVADNVGMRGVLDTMEVLEALHAAGQKTRLDNIRRMVVLVVNSMSSPPIAWDRSPSPPGTVAILLKSAGVPIDQFSFESIELLRDIGTRWRTMRTIRESPEFKASRDPKIAAITRTPDTEVYAIDVSFAQLRDEAEREYLNGLPTSFVLPDEAVDRLRAAAGKLIMDSPEFQRLLRDVGARVVEPPPSGSSKAVPAPGAK
ncbi:MAG: heme-binding protein [Burkholderiales bacterium]